MWRHKSPQYTGLHPTEPRADRFRASTVHDATTSERSTSLKHRTDIDIYGYLPVAPPSVLPLGQKISNGAKISCLPLA